jgi:hypothetical protein
MVDSHKGLKHPNIASKNRKYLACFKRHILFFKQCVFYSCAQHALLPAKKQAERVCLAGDFSILPTNPCESK